MSSCRVANFQKFDEEKLNSGTWIVLLNTNKIPPHLALIANGKYYTLRFDGPIIGEDTSAILSLIQRKKIPTLFVETKLECNDELIKFVFSQYDMLIPGKTTCLHPIKRLVAEIQSIKLNRVEYVFDLINKLNQLDLLGKPMQLFMNDEIIDDKYNLKIYTHEEISKCIDELHDREE